MTFLQQVTENLIQQYTFDGLQQCTLVFPMHRAGLFVKQYLGEKIQSSGNPIVLPQFATIDSLVDSLCELHSEEEIISVCKLYEIYAKHTHCTLPIDAFYGWGVQLLNDFSNVDMALVESSQFMTYTSQAKQYEQMLLDNEARERLEHLLHPDTPPKEHSIREYFTALWEALPKIYEEFSQKQLDANVGTRGARYRWTIDNFTHEAIQQRIQGRIYVFIGFNYLLAAERRLMQLFKDQNQALFYWDYDPDFTLDNTVYKFIHDHMDKFPNALQPATCNLQPAITAIACQSSSAQAQYVHDWLMMPEHRNGSAAVVVADESLLQTVIYSLPDSNQLTERLNITKGYPLRGTVLHTHVLQFLQGHTDTTSSPEQLLKDLIADLYKKYTDAHLPYNSESLKHTWQATLLDESYYQIQRVLRQLLTILIQNDFVQGHLNQSRILCNLIRRQLETVTVPFHGEPVTDIQIIGMLETRLLDFDHVLILNVEEDIVPSRHSERSFLPYDLRCAYGMSTREDESRIYAYNFFRLFRRAQDVTLTYSDSFTDNRMCTMSRFLMQMLAVPNNHIVQSRLSESAKVDPYQLANTAFGDDATDTVPDHLSPSSISTYIECHRQFYLKQIRHLRESSIDEVMLPVGLIGNLCHTILQQAYIAMAKHIDPYAVDSELQLTRSIPITKDLIDWYMSDEKHFAQALERGYEEINERYAKDHKDAEIQAPYVAANHEAENFAILEMAKKVLKRDMEQAPFTLVWLEHQVEITINDLTIQGVIDRMDIMEQDGAKYLRVLDYKTGGFEDKKISFDYPELIQNYEKRYALQTLIYSEMVKRNLPKDIDQSLPIRPELFFIKKRSQADQLVWKIDKDESPIADYVKDSQSKFLTQFEAITKQIANNCQPGQVFEPQSDEKICQKSYCPFHLLCAREKKEW